jgi:predicted transglutaminase-like cysteine proteinase
MKHKAVMVMVAAAVLGASSLIQASPVSARSAHYTITQRQVQLTREVNAGLKANELTLKEATKLRERMTDVNSSISKMKEKNGGKLSYKDQGKVEKSLNSISVDMQKEKLQKRVTAR